MPGEERIAAHTPQQIMKRRLWNSARARSRTPAIELSDTGQSRSHPRRYPPTAGVGDDSTDHGNAGARRGDHVADPVDEVEERGFRLRSGLALDRHIYLRCRAKGTDWHTTEAECQGKRCNTYMPPFVCRPPSGSTPHCSARCEFRIQKTNKA